MHIRRMFETALARAPVVLSIQDLQLRYTWIHDPSFGLFEDALGRTDEEIFPPGSAGTLVAIKTAVLTSRVGTRQEIALETRFGVRHYDLSVEPFWNLEDQFAGVACSAIDITERVAAKAASQAEELRFRLAAEAVNGIIYEYNLADGHVERTRGLFEVCGYHPEDVPATADWWRAQIHPDDRLRLDREFFPVRQNRCYAEYRIRHKDGYWLRVEDRGVIVRNADGKPGKIVGCAIDVTDRRRVEDELRERTTQLDFALAATGVGMWLNPMPLGDLFWDQRTRDMFFVADLEQPSIGLFWSRLHPDDREPTRSAIEEAIRNRTVYAIDHRAVDPRTGAVRWIRSSGLASYAPDGEPVRFDGINYDITERKQQEEVLHAMTQQLRDDDERKDRFLATLAHELRNPLAPIRNAVQVIKHAAHSSAEVRWSGEVIDRQLATMSRLLDDLLDVSRISQDKLVLRVESCDLRDIVDSAIEISRPVIDAAGHSLTVEMSDGPLTVAGDPVRLAQVFSNLLNNAAKYTQAGGRLAIAVGRHGNSLRVDVRDNGIGISAGLLPRVFEMFTQGERALARAQGGLGIGLSLVRGLVNLHGGAVAVTSDGVNLGSTFSVTLPATAPKSRAHAVPASEPASRVQASSRRVLVVDDVQDSADSLALWLAMSGHETRTAYDGQAALLEAERFRPHVIVMDIGMPDMSGLDVCGSIRGQPWGSTTMLVAMTGWGSGDDRRRTRDAGFDRHLVKPVDPIELDRLFLELEARPQRADL